MSYTLSPDQVSALRQIGAWYRAKSSPYLTLGGYAGTGKTTLIGYMRQALADFDPDATVGFCAYTGKATRVLHDKLRTQRSMRRGDTVTTIHSLIYNTDDSRGGVHWVRKDKLERSLLVVDEASMVDEDIWRDLLAFNIPILAVGDHGQLPPIGSSFNLMKEPQVRLEQIFRQAEDSPIITLATSARETGIIEVGEFGAGVRKLDRAQPETGIIVEELLAGWRPGFLVLCGYNATRLKLNQAIRALRDIESPEPVSGDVVVCLRGNRTKRIYNGMIGRVVRMQKVHADDGTVWYDAEIAVEDEEITYTGYVLAEQFGASSTTSDIPLAPDGQRGDLWDFGYALTVHKAQGSQAPAVLVFEERFARSSEDDWRRWLYTAVTRAESSLTIVGPNPTTAD